MSLRVDLMMHEMEHEPLMEHEDMMMHDGRMSREGAMPLRMHGEWTVRLEDAQRLMYGVTHGLT